MLKKTNTIAIAMDAAAVVTAGMAIGTFMTGTAQAVNFGGSVTGGAGGSATTGAGGSGGTGACGGSGGTGTWGFSRQWRDWRSRCWHWYWLKI